MKNLHEQSYSGINSIDGHFGEGEPAGFGASLGIDQADVQYASVHEKGNAQVMFERFENGAKDFLKNTGERIWNKGVEIFGRCKAWAQGKWEKIKTVTSEWVGDVVETVKLNTVDKWRFLNEREESNKLIAHKVRDIADLKGRAETEAHNITIFEANKVADNEKFAPAVASAKDPVIREIFKRTWDDKIMASDQGIESARSVIDNVEGVTMEYAREIVQFQQNVEQAGSAFTEKIDTHIEKIRTKCGFYELQEQIDGANSEIESHNTHIRYLDEKITEYSQALTTAQEMGVSEEDCQTLQNGIASFESKKNDALSNIKRLQESTYPLYIKIQNINGKTRRYEDMKKKMGLEPIAESVSETDTETSTETQETTTPDVEEEMESEPETQAELKSEAEIEVAGANNEDEEDIVEDVVEDIENIDSIDNERKEAVRELLSEKINDLYALIMGPLTKTTVTEIVFKNMKIGELATEYEDVFTQDEKDGLFAGIAEIKKTYDKRGIEKSAPVVITQLRRDVLNKIIKRLPDWIIQ